MKLVTDGKLWAVQRGWFFKSYFDLKTPGYWWSIGSGFLEDCWGDKELAEKWFKRLTL